MNDTEKIAAINAKLVEEGPGLNVRPKGSECVMLDANRREVLRGDLDVLAHFILGLPLGEP